MTNQNTKAVYLEALELGSDTFPLLASYAKEGRHDTIIECKHANIAIKRDVPGAYRIRFNFSFEQPYAPALQLELIHIDENGERNPVDTLSIPVIPRFSMFYALSQVPSSPISDKDVASESAILDWLTAANSQQPMERSNRDQGTQMDLFLQDIKIWLDADEPEQRRIFANASIAIQGNTAIILAGNTDGPYRNHRLN